MPNSPIACRRAALSQATGGSHAGLLLHRYLRERAEQGENKGKSTQNLLTDLTRMEANAPYRAAFARWKAVQNARPEASLFTATLTAPLAIGLGSESVTEVGLTLHHTYGMPYIPGSALKGLCRRAAAELKTNVAAELKTDAPTDFLILFGDNSAASHLVFWDAWYDSESVGGCPFLLDTITVHHPQYYQKKGVGVWPTDFDDPTPIPFLCVKPGAQFLFTLDAPTREWADLARRLLAWGLINLGAGGKTNAGYGYFAARENAQSSQNNPPQSASTLAALEVGEWAGVTLTYQPGKNNLLETRQGAEKAFVDGAASRELIAALPEEVQGQVRRNRRLENVTLQIKLIGGSNYSITGIIYPSP